MKKILVILTGGTIGSKIEDNVINVNSQSPYRLLSMYEEQYRKEEFDVIQPVNVLSENMTPDIWLKLFRAVEQIDCGKYDGIIVTHGSDTLSYTAAFMGMLFHHLPIPLVMVASNYPLGQKGSNGLNNFACAVEFIRTKAVRGVFVIYSDDAGMNHVYLATRLVEADPCFDQFKDFGKVPFGKMECGKFTVNKNGWIPSIQEVETHSSKELEVPQYFDKDILVIRPYPGMNYSQFDLSKKPAAVLHYLYHSATACTDETAGDYNLLPFVKKCRELGIDFYTASYKQTEGKQYATADALLQAGVTPLLNISVEAAYAKLMLIYHQKQGDFKRMARQDFYFETIPAKNA